MTRKMRENIVKIRVDYERWMGEKNECEKGVEERRACGQRLETDERLVKVS
jgi:hypothetical protein